MNWGDIVLRLLIRRRNRDSISGDLLEEYREHVVPTMGPRAARLWYIRQILSLVSPLTWGLTIGIIFGGWQLVDTAIEPLADDSGGTMAVLLGSLLLLWTLTSVAASLRSRQFTHAILAGTLAGLATMAVLDVSAILRVNIFLEEIRYREDWINLMARFDASGFQSLRMYANWEYFRGTPVILGLGALGGAMCGAIAGVISAMTAMPLRRASN